MANGHGGKRTPAHPAPVSGPGALSRRTDGGPADRQAMRDLPNAAYGEQKANREIQAGADMAGPSASPVPPAQAIIPLGDPTNRPNEPVTAGNPYGPGIGPQAAGVDQRTPDQKDAAALQSFLPALEFMAQLPDASPSTIDLLRRIKGSL